MLIELNKIMFFCSSTDCEDVIRNGTYVNCMNETTHKRSKRASDDGIEILFDVSGVVAKRDIAYFFSTRLTRRMRH